MTTKEEEFRECVRRAWDLYMDSNLSDTKLFGEAVDRFGESCKSIAKEMY